MKTILVTAFDAFGGLARNPSELVLDNIENNLKGKRIIKLVLPTVYGEAENRLIAVMRKEDPDFILLLGYSKAAKPIKLEEIARNRDSQTAKDNQGQTGKEVIVSGGPKAIRATLPIKKIIKLWDSRKISYKLSTNAGGFLCNHVSYIAMNWLAMSEDKRNVPCGFMHVGKNSEDIAIAKKAVELVLTLA